MSGARYDAPALPLGSRPVPRSRSTASSPNSQVPDARRRPRAAAAQPITPATFAMGVIVCTFWGTVLAHRAARPRHTWIRVSTTLVVISLAAPLAAAHTEPATRLTLAAAHLIGAAIVIPLLARRLAP